MTDELIERVAKEIHISAFRDAPWPNGGHVAMQEKALREVKMVLSALRPGDVLPNGLVAAHVSDLPLATKLINEQQSKSTLFDKAMLAAEKGDN